MYIYILYLMHVSSLVNFQSLRLQIIVDVEDTIFLGFFFGESEIFVRVQSDCFYWYIVLRKIRKTLKEV